MTHIHFCTIGNDRSGLVGHPQEVMRELGITYQYAIPQSMTDSWEFWNCENLPPALPKALTIKDWDPMGRIGYGLSKEKAESIRDYKPAVKVFNDDKERIKRAVMEEAVNFCEMIDCVDEPPALEYTVNKYGVKIKITAEIE